MTIQNKMTAIRNSVAVRYLSIWIITGLTFGILGVKYDIMSVLAYDEVVYTYTKPVTPCTTIECQLYDRTIQIYERDRDIYLEQSRLEAIRELNTQLLGMVYKSPHVDFSEVIE
jgi:hypothetical protein